MKLFVQKKIAYTKFEPTLYSIYYSFINYPRLFNRTPIRCKDYSLSCNPFFIIGSGRSGNTLLRAVLSAHQDIAIPPESYVLGSVAKTFQKIRYEDWLEVSKTILSVFDKYPQFHTWRTDLKKLYPLMNSLRKTDRGLDKLIDSIYLQYINQNKPLAKRWGDKTPLNVFHLWWIDQVFPNAQYIHIIRDGRDVVNSYIKSGIYSSPEKAAERWLLSVEFAQNFGEQIGNDRYTEVRYENLVKTPETEIKKICGFLKIDYNKNMLHPQSGYGKLGDATRAKHHSNLKKPINLDSIGKWKRELTRSDKTTLSKLLDKSLIELGYE